MKTCEKICKECPFTNTSSPGWLGPHTVEDLKIYFQSEYPFSCHLHRTEDTTEEDVIQGRIPVCRGFLASANKSCKLFGTNGKIGQELMKLQKTIKEDSSKILAKWELEKHHSLLLNNN